MDDPSISKTIGYFTGERWHSYDNGKTWERRPRLRFGKEKPTGTMTVVKVDHLHGTITVEIG